MAAITKEADLPVSAEDVWAKLTDAASHGEWLVTHVDYPDGVPELAEGATYREKVTIMGMPGEVQWTVVRLVEGSEMQLEGKGPMETVLKAAYRVVGDGSGCKVTFETEFGGAALAAMAGPLENASAQALERSIAQFQALVAA